MNLYSSAGATIIMQQPQAIAVESSTNHSDEADNGVMSNGVDEVSVMHFYFPKTTSFITVSSQPTQKKMDRKYSAAVMFPLPGEVTKELDLHGNLVAQFPTVHL